ncbi:helix-turn-helix domain-containing protein, partial [Peribacillus butanolivorans]|uniref:helix-turn-helix domain-containing protein n=1 Tax=Peribacillus butanolivorans TaxID=421767 RepID=UPI00366E2B97
MLFFLYLSFEVELPNKCFYYFYHFPPEDSLFKRVKGESPTLRGRRMAVGISQSYFLTNIRSIVNNNYKGVKPMVVNKSYKFRIYPTKEQLVLINKTIGCSRFVYNFFLGKQKEKDASWYICEEMKQNG